MAPVRSPKKGSKPRSPSRTPKRVYSFGNGRAEGRASMCDRLGGKGSNLAEMTRLGIPVPPGFTISAEVCPEFLQGGRKLPVALRKQVLEALARVERELGAGFGDLDNPLLVSVRSGARVSMPGMMDTILNLGLNDATVKGLAKQSGEPRMAFDSYRRFVQMYGNVVLGVPIGEFEGRFEARKQARGLTSDTELDAADLRHLVKDYKGLIRDRSGREFPEDPQKQLFGAIAAVFESWNTARAVTYRRLNSIPDEWGTAVNVQAMVFGNLGDESATGVAFTRNPTTGERRLFGEFLPNAQGEDVVAGIRTPRPIDRRSRKAGEPPSLEELQPSCYRALLRVARTLELHYRDMQDLEFTIQKGKLWMLQTRAGKRSASAAVRIAVEMVRERRIDVATALTRIDPNQLDQLFHPMLDPEATPEPIGHGLPASPGAASGTIVFSAEDAERSAELGKEVILVRRETSAEDINGMHAARGILTALGGMTSHAAVVARGMGTCCVAGCSELRVDSARGVATLGSVEFVEGDEITLDGSTGRIYRGRVSTVEAEMGPEFRTLMRWADRVRRLRVRTNVDTPADAETARRFGAEGIGLCRTEHMFFEAERILEMRRMILARTSEDRARALDELLPMQREDFIGIFRAMSGLPVTIRLLDPPLQECLPKAPEEVDALARDLKQPLEEVRRAVEEHLEFNPMLGHRGCRLAITFPEIYQMQVRAILEAACRSAREGLRPRPEIMIPLVADAGELAELRALVEATARDVFREQGRRVRYSLGTMIEVPRAALTAARIAEIAEFFSFGTNDLTQTALALSRDDAGRFLPTYVEKGIFDADPFITLDIPGVGALIRQAVAEGRRTRPDLKLGICGEHGGDPASIRFCEEVGMDYVSCSPYRVPVARLAAAQAVLEAGRAG